MKKVILLTGASSGIGLSIATSLAAKGYFVYGASRSIQGEFNFTALQMDVTSPQSIESAVQQIVEKEGRIDVLINNAGLGIIGPVENLQLEDVEKLFNTNLFGVLRTCKSVLPIMRNQKSGIVINISSIGSEMGLPYRGAYSASKAALDRLSEALRMEVKNQGIQVCTIQPGGIATDIHKNRVMSPMPENSPYRASFDKAYQIINESVQEGLDPEIFGAMIEKIFHAKRIKRNYRFGKSKEKLSVLLKRLLPDSVFEKIIMNHYKMS